MFKKIITALVLFPAIAFAEMQSYTQGNTESKVFINDGAFECEFFSIDQGTGLAQSSQNAKKGNAAVYVKNTTNGNLAVIISLSDTVLISAPPLHLEQGKGNAASYGYSSGEDIYRLISTPQTGMMMVVNAKNNNIEVNASIMNCSDKKQ